MGIYRPLEPQGTLNAALLGRGGGFALAAGAVMGCQAAPPWRLVETENALPSLVFSMEDVKTRRQVTEADYRGQVAVLFFGYTYCPDVCPTTFGALTAALNRMSDLGSQVTILFVTVDPKRDTTEALSEYLSNFTPRAVGLRGSANQLAALARRYRVAYSANPGTTPDAYTVNHTASSFIFDRDGRSRLLAPYGSSPDDLENDLRRLLSA